MTLQQAIAARHAVRSYSLRPIGPAVVERLSALVGTCNEQSGLDICLVTEEPQAFSGRLAHYGKFSGVRNYLVMAGTKGPHFDERIGYWGEHLVLAAQALGLNSCWVGLTYKKVPEVMHLQPAEKLRCVIALGYGVDGGRAHRVKTFDQVARAARPVPEWFSRAVEAALLAPTAMNQQKFSFRLSADGCVHASAGLGFFTKVDLGIAKYHFELGAAPHQVVWER